MNSTYEFALKEGQKVKMKIFRRTKSWRKILKKLKRKVDIFIRTKNIFNPKTNVKTNGVPRELVISRYVAHQKTKFS